MNEGLNSVKTKVKKHLASAIEKELDNHEKIKIKKPKGITILAEDFTAENSLKYVLDTIKSPDTDGHS